MKQTESNKKRGRNSIGKKSLRSMILLWIMLVAASSIASGLQIFRVNMDRYKDHAYAFADLAAANIRGDAVERYLKTGQRDDYYERILLFLYTSAVKANLRYYYVVVPTEEDLIYIWDTYGPSILDKYKDGQPVPESATLLEHDSYAPGEKEAMMKVLDGTWDKKLEHGVSNEGEPLATALTPIYGTGGAVIAVVGVDISLTELVAMIVYACVNMALIITVVLTIGLLIFYHVIQRSLVKPIVLFRNATEELVENLDENKEISLDIHSGDEIEDLAVSFEEMGRRLKEYIRENTSITAERERFTTELDLARRIQKDMLPSVFPPFPEKEEIDIFASMDTAKEVGGDFYDFFLIDERRLGLVIADVSGKGIPAALFMMMSRIMLQDYALSESNLAEVMEKVNDRICLNNEEEMFVTVWIGVLDLDSGVIRAVNAGHEYPYLRQPGEDFRMIRDVHGFVVGAESGMKYQEYELTMKPGASLFLYTDGIPEAADENDQMFGTDRMCAALNKAKDSDSREVLRSVLRDVNEFVAQAPRFDDMTMMCVRYLGKKEHD